MKATAKVVSTGGIAKLKAALDQLARSRVMVGIPEDAPTRGAIPFRIGRATVDLDAKVTNAQLMFIHTNGSPMRGIPPRPVIEPAIQAPDNAALIAEQLGAATAAMLAGDPFEAQRDLKTAGTVAANAVKRWFVDPRNQWAPNSPATIARKGSSNPLIDTGQLRRAVTYVVTK